MARVLITGSSDGLGLMASRLLLEQGHTVVAHARNAQRAEQTRRTSGCGGGSYRDLSSLEQTRALAHNANELGAFDAVIHKCRYRLHRADPQVLPATTYQRCSKSTPSRRTC